MATYEQMLAGQGTCSGCGRAMEWEDEYSQEFEYEDEYEDEWGDILGGIAKGIGGLFGETEDEFSNEFSPGLSHEIVHEGEAEDEACFGKLAKIASRGVPSPALENLARRAARSAMQASAPTRALDTVLSVLSETELESELAQELHEFEDEYELNPVRKVYLDAMMEHLAHAAAEAETESEAAAFIAPLASLAVKALPKVLKLAPKVIKTVSKAVPHMAKAAHGVAKTLRQNPATRPMARILPTAIKRGAATLAKHVAAGHHVTPRHARQAIAHHSARIIRNPQQAVNIYRRARALDRNFHRFGPPRVAAAVGGRHHPIHGWRTHHQGARPPHALVAGRRPVSMRPGYAGAPGAAAYRPPHHHHAPVYAHPVPGHAPIHGYGGHVPGAIHTPGYMPVPGVPVPGIVGGVRCQCTCVPY